MENTVCVILAAGKGTRMKSRLPKVLHQINGQPMVNDVLDMVDALGIKRVIVVTGHKGDLVKSHLGDVETIHQKTPLGTGHAVGEAEKVLSDFKGDILVLYGDTPLLTAETLKKLLTKHRTNGACCTLLTTTLKQPTGYGRIVRDSKDKIVRIVEERDACEKERAIKEINAGSYCFKSEELFRALKKIKPDNRKGEYYLTDTIAILAKQGLKIESLSTNNHKEVLGVDSKEDLAKARKITQGPAAPKIGCKGV